MFYQVTTDFTNNTGDFLPSGLVLDEVKSTGDYIHFGIETDVETDKSKLEDGLPIDIYLSKEEVSKYLKEYNPNLSE